MVQKELLLRSKKTTSRSELVEDIFPLTNSWISTLLLSLRNLKERTHLEDLAKRLQFKRQLLITESEKQVQLEETVHLHLEDKEEDLQINMRFEKK